MAKKTAPKTVGSTGDLPGGATTSESATTSETAAVIQAGPAPIPPIINDIAAYQGDDPVPAKAVMARTVKLDGKLYREGDELDVSKSVFAKLSALGAVVEARKA